MTGGNGFIGSHLVDAYRAAGHSVKTLDRAADADFSIDLSDTAAVSDAVASFEPELINHHAAHHSIPASIDDPQANAQANILGSLNLFEAALKLPNKPRIIAASSAAVYGPDVPVPSPETTTLEPISPYGVSKLAMERYLHYYHAKYGLEWVAFRYVNVYGPNQSPASGAAIVSFITKLLGGQSPIITGDGSQRRSFLFVDDVVRANQLATKTGAGVYNLSPTSETSISELFHLIADTIGTSIQPTVTGTSAGVPRSGLDAKRAAEELDWQPTITLADGLKQTVDWYQAQSK